MSEGIGPASPAEAPGPARTLVIGIGNRDRGDDGVAYEVVNALRRSLGGEPLSDEEGGLERLCDYVDGVAVAQLSPEWLELSARYGRLVFVDAHVLQDREDVWCAPVQVEAAGLGFTHTVTPELFVALLSGLYHVRPAAYLVSIKGSDFEFRRGLSARMAARVEPAVDCILRLMASAVDSAP